MSQQSDSSDKPTVMPSTQGDFKQWLTTLKADIRRAQLRAALSVNSELLHLYWRMGRDICAGQQSASWGDGWLRELSRELMAEFPSMKGFSYRNLRYMRQWYQFYSQTLAIGQQAVANLGDAFFAVPWGHHLYIMSQYAPEATSQPIGISEYSLSHVLPKEIQSQLPTIDEIESSLKG